MSLNCFLKPLLGFPPPLSCLTAVFLKLGLFVGKLSGRFGKPPQQQKLQPVVFFCLFKQVILKTLCICGFEIKPLEDLNVIPNVCLSGSL